MPEYHTISVSNGSSIYDVGVQELRRVTQDEGARRAVENELNEARGREAARLHVQLKTLAEADQRSATNARATIQAIERLSNDLQERASHLSHLIQSFEAVAEKRFGGVTDTVNARADALASQLNQRSDALAAQVTGFTNVEREHFEMVHSQLNVSTERLAQDVRMLRDEVVKLVDSRMNQADASFAAIRGDIEVLKFLVMDLIKARIGRVDPNQKSF